MFSLQFHKSVQWLNKINKLSVFVLVHAVFNNGIDKNCF